MTDPNLTSITIILDRSGSMADIEKDTVGGFNAFIDEQKKIPGRCEVGLIRFDGEYNIDYIGKPIADVPKLTTIHPRGSTALRDAICKTIDELGARLQAQPEHARPGKVVVVIITDGEENASRLFKAHHVKERIEHQRHVYGWQFVYLGANQNAILTAADMGIGAALSADFSGLNVKNAFCATSSNIGGYRNGGTQVAAYSAAQREEMLGPQGPEQLHAGLLTKDAFAQVRDLGLAQLQRSPLGYDEPKNQVQADVDAMSKAVNDAITRSAVATGTPIVCDEVASDCGINAPAVQAVLDRRAAAGVPLIP